jgi:hypothetical protein
MVILKLYSAETFPSQKPAAMLLTSPYSLVPSPLLYKPLMDLPAIRYTFEGYLNDFGFNSHQSIIATWRTPATAFKFITKFNFITKQKLQNKTNTKLL